jgi:hypothetical protein
LSIYNVKKFPGAGQERDDGEGRGEAKGKEGKGRDGKGRKRNKGKETASLCPRKKM